MKSPSNRVSNVLLGTTFMLLCMFFALSSCTNSSSDEDTQEETMCQHNISIENQLKNTCWKQYKRITGDGRTLTNMQRILSFTPTPVDFGTYGTCYRTKSGDKYCGIWFVQEDGTLCMYTFYSDFDAFGNGENSMGYGVGKLQILKRTTNELVYRMGENDEANYYYYTSTNIGGDNGTGGGSTSYEKPDIGFNDFTAYQTKLKVVYKIYNKDEAKVTSAKVYYGTSTNPTKSVSASVAGVLITANISGLKKGTTYYVKCVATGKGGTATTETTKLITNY